MTMIYASCNLVTRKIEAGVYGCQTLPKNTKVTGYKALKNGFFWPIFYPMKSTVYEGTQTLINERNTTLLEW